MDHVTLGSLLLDTGALDGGSYIRIFTFGHKGA